MEFIDKNINEELNKELEAEESNRVEDFKVKSNKRFFATISAFIDKDWYLKQSSKEDKGSWEGYCNRATGQLQNELKRIGLEYQRTTGIWEGSLEKSFLVWNTSYTFEHFQAIMLKLNENYKQWGICIGKWVEEEKKYSIDLWETNSLDNIVYSKTKHFTTVTVIEALRDSGTILTRKIRNSNGETNLEKVQAVKFESLEKNICCTASESMAGYYRKRDIIREMFGKDI